MIKFFRHIRKRLLAKNKFSNYLLYAIGEIILVVIGILIALGINNWNEKRKTIHTIESLISAFEKELNTNIEESNVLIDEAYVIDSMTTRFLNNEMTRDDFLKSSFIVSFGTITRQYKDDNLDALIAYEKEMPKKYEPLVPVLKLLKARIESQRIWEEKVIEISMARKKELADQLPTRYLTDSISMEKNITFYLTDPYLKSKIIHYNNYNLNENTWDASLIRTTATAILWEIKNLRSNDVISIDSFLESSGLEPFTKYDCDKLPTESIERLNFSINFVVFNTTDTEVNFNIINKDGTVLNLRAISVPPRAFYLDEISINEDKFIQVLDNDSCKAIYHRNKKDYFILN